MHFIISNTLLGLILKMLFIKKCINLKVNVKVFLN